MAEVLSQSQIDALLSTVLSGEVDLEENSEPKYRKYDFYSPRKFTKDRMKMLHSVFDNYTRMINTRINSLLHTNCEIEVESVEEQRYYEFSNALTEGDVLTLAYLQNMEDLENTPVLLHVTTPVMLSMMDRMMGGEGMVDNTIPSEYTFTDVELRLYEIVMQDFIGVIGNSWENYIKLDFSYGKVEVNPTLVQLLGLDETVVIIDINLKFDNCDGRLSICLPGTMLTHIFTEISKENPAKLSKEDNSEQIFDRLRNTELEIVAELGTTQLLLSDIYHLNVGDVINLNQPKASPVFLKIGGKTWFNGQMGKHKKSMAVKIGETFYRTERRSEQLDGE